MLCKKVKPTVAYNVNVIRHYLTVGECYGDSFTAQMCFESFWSYSCLCIPGHFKGPNTTQVLLLYSSTVCHPSEGYWLIEYAYYSIVSQHRLVYESTVRGYYEMDEWIDAFSDDDVVEVSFKHSVESSNKRGKNCRKRRKVVLANKVESGDCDKTLWLSKYKPKTCAEVSGNKAKILQLRTWIEQFLKSNIQKQDSKLLLLTGPSGCGKTAAIEAVAKELSCSVVLWNGEYSDYVQ
ncbi:RAD17 [Bugula neritina]|uniref:RAD17 n=1 Tax=Bugula neritina TaxID=10212 RepID=A0A7J7KF15_BUGNE|nr:RAD17 [Bugula neritina]